MMKFLLLPFVAIASAWYIGDVSKKYVIKKYKKWKGNK